MPTYTSLVYDSYVLISYVYVLVLLIAGIYWYTCIQIAERI